MPAIGGNTAALIGDYAASIDAMAAEIDTATRFVNVEFYIVVVRRDDEGLLRRDGARGPARRAVRLLVDFIASRKVAEQRRDRSPSSIGSG